MSSSPAADPTRNSASIAAPSQSVCAHCGDSLAMGKPVQRMVGPRLQSFCCLGCAFIAEQLFLAQAGTRDRAALDERLAEALPRPQAQRSIASAERSFEIHGMVCAACGLLIEHRLRKVPGVLSAYVDAVTQRAQISFDPTRCKPEQLQQAIKRAGYRALPAGQSLAPRLVTRHQRFDLLRLLLAWLAMMQVMMLSVPAYVASPGDITPDIEQLLRIGQLVLTVPVLMFCSWPLLKAAWSQVRAADFAVLSMDLPIVIGLLSAFVVSTWATVQGQGPVYFDSISMFVALVLGTRWLTARGLLRAQGHIDAVLHQAHPPAARLRAWPGTQTIDRISAAQLNPGDRVLVAAGESVPADGVVLDGTSAVSQAWLTGEATPIEKTEGMPVLAGSLNLEQPLVLQVTRAGEATSLAALRRLVDAAARERPPIVETAQRVAIGFLWAVLAVTATTVGLWLLIDPTQALPNAIAVLIATCPCALALAAPAVLAATQACLAKHGVLTARVAALETLARADTFAFDKTGTLTAAAPLLERVVPLRAVDVRSLLALAAAMESLSTHPFARSLAAVARVEGITPPAIKQGSVQIGAGVEAHIDGIRMRLGKPDFALGLVETDPMPTAARLLKRMEREKLAANSVIVLADSDGPLGLFVFGETLRPDANAVIESLRKRGADLLLLSGDRREPVERVARHLNIQQAFAHQTPESKRERVAQLQQAGHTVAMVGDGMNDAPVIAQADVSIALASDSNGEHGGSALAQARADFIVVSGRISEVAYAADAARRGMRILRQNLAWAIGYNVVMVPLAAAGLLTPLLAAVGMAASSLIVIGNALRAARD